MAAGIYGLVAQDFWAAFLGLHASAAMKIWFVDRMEWLYDEKHAGGRASPLAKGF